MQAAAMQVASDAERTAAAQPRHDFKTGDESRECRLFACAQLIGERECR